MLELSSCCFDMLLTMNNSRKSAQSGVTRPRGRGGLERLCARVFTTILRNRLYLHQLVFAVSYVHERYKNCYSSIKYKPLPQLSLQHGSQKSVKPNRCCRTRIQHSQPELERLCVAFLQRFQEICCNFPATVTFMYEIKLALEI